MDTTEEVDFSDHEHYSESDIDYEYFVKEYIGHDYQDRIYNNVELLDEEIDIYRPEEEDDEELIQELLKNMSLEDAEKYILEFSKLKIKNDF